MVWLVSVELATYLVSISIWQLLAIVVLERANGTLERRICAWMLETGSEAWAGALKKIVYDRNNERARVLRMTAFKMFFARENWHHKRAPEDLQIVEWDMNDSIEDDDPLLHVVWLKDLGFFNAW